MLVLAFAPAWAVALVPAWALAPPAPRDAAVACVVSHQEAGTLFDVCRGKQGAVTVDLGCRKPDAVTVGDTHVAVSFGTEEEQAMIPIAFLTKLAKKKRSGVWECFADGDDPCKVEGFSERTSRTASLFPLEGATPPTCVLAGFNMHRMKLVTPSEDTERKLGALGSSLRGTELDVCSGLGYTAIGAASRSAVTAVVTIELDPLMVEMQRANPWSRELFADAATPASAKITRALADATELLPCLPDGAFDACVHDPPANALSGELYSAAFYSELRRVLRPGGVLFHYIGDPSSAASGKLFKGITERLREAGFEAVKASKKAYGIAAVARGNGRASAAG